MKFIDNDKGITFFTKVRIDRDYYKAKKGTITEVVGYFYSGSDINITCRIKNGWEKMINASVYRVVHESIKDHERLYNVPIEYVTVLEDSIPELYQIY